MHRRSIPLLIGLAYVALAVLYGLATPMFEAPDENYHFAFAQRLAQDWALPVQNPAVETPWFQEGSQPPLYYYLAALVIRLSGAADPIYQLPVNPHAAIGLGLAQINNNFFLHTGAESFPWQGPVLAFYLVRLLSAALGAWTLYALYRAARLALPGVAAFALAFTAFLPMFLFLSASVNNDNLVTALSVTALWLMLLIVQRGFAWRRAALLAVVLALAALSKLSGLALYIVAGALLCSLLWKRRVTPGQGLFAGLLLLAAFALVAGWWYVRNHQLYGDFTGLSAMIAIILPRPAPYTLDVFLNEMGGLRISFWALFGWFNVIGPDWFFSLMDVFTGLALIGGMLWVGRQWRAGQFEALLPVGLLAFHFLVTFAALINWTRQTPGTQGRLLFPALPGIALLMTLGWRTAAEMVGVKSGKTSVRAALAVLPLAVMFGVAALSPFLTIIPAYAPPPVVEALPDDATPALVRFDRIELLGYRIDPAPRLPGEGLPITLYYRGAPDERNLSLYLTALDRHDRPVGKIDSYPGGGNLPTSAFVPGQIYADNYVIPIARGAAGPMQFKIECGWWDFATKERVQPVRPDGSPLEALILRGGTLLASAAAPEPAVAQRAIFSGALRLNGYTLTQDAEQIELTLIWEGLARVHEDFQVMVHLVAGEATPVAQGDSAPLQGDYPTSAWAPNRPFADTYTLSLADVPPGTYRLLVGLYRLADFSRLPVDLGGDVLVLETPITVR